MYNKSELTKMCEHLSEMENRAAKAQRESVKYKQCEYLKDKVGEKFKAVVSTVRDFGVFAEIIENGCNGLISRDSLEYNNLFVDESNYCINNFNSGDSYRLGDEITVEVTSVNMTRKEINFKLILN